MPADPTGPGLPADVEALVRRAPPGDHRVTAVLDGEQVETLADLPPERDRLLFVGLRPSAASVASGHYHQDAAGRTFWEHLARAGILSRGTPPEEADDALAARGHGITDLAKRPSGNLPVRDAELRAGVGVLWQKIALWRPAAVVFVERTAAEAAAGRALDEPWGHLAGVALAGRPCFLMPDAAAPPDTVDAGLNLLRNLLAALPG